MSQKKTLVLLGVLIIATALLIGCGSEAAPPTVVAVASSPTVVPTIASSPIPPTPMISSMDCKACHSDIVSNWQNGVHANTQTDVAKELGEERSRQTSNDVIHGQDAENCIACHAPKATTVTGIANEMDALNHFFSTADGKFTADTQTMNATDWPQINCETCHNVTDNHQTAKLSFGLFSSQTAQFVSLDDSNKQCGQCHGDLLFAGTDHQTYNAWASSKHSVTQADVATELDEERSGQTPDDVINGEDTENCIACHAPTATLANGGMDETQALTYFFTTSDGKFSADTTVAHDAEWTNVSCTSCHDPHNPGSAAYFNSATKKYEPMKDTNELCGQCHGNLRFSDTDHLSYNINAGTGGMGVPDQRMTPNVACTDCHMYASDVDGSNSAMFGGHTWAIDVKESDGQTTSSCTHCHSDWDVKKSDATVNQMKEEFQALDTKVQTTVETATQAMEGVTTPELQDKLKEAQFNLSYAESDESGGFHNHTYLMTLLNDASQKAQEILTALGK